MIKKNLYNQANIYDAILLLRFLLKS